MTAIKGILFDKDGTLFDFQATWNAWAHAALLDLAGNNTEAAAELGALIGYDFARRVFDVDSVVIAGTTQEIVAQLSKGVPQLSPNDLLARLDAKAAATPQVEAVPLRPLMAELSAGGYRLGVATNDSEAPARAHLASVGLESAFDFIAGYDSGYGGKPDPGMCQAFAAQMGLVPDACVMVGDSRHDLLAGQSAGMRTIGVLTGMADAATLAPLATDILPSIGALPGWLATRPSA